MPTCAQCGESAGEDKRLALYSAHIAKSPPSRDPNDLQFVYNVWLHSGSSMECVMDYRDPNGLDIIALSMIRRG